MDSKEGSEDVVVGLGRGVVVVVVVIVVAAGEEKRDPQRGDGAAELKGVCEVQ